jgi:DNA polymerase-3 subunit gamma/tau
VAEVVPEPVADAEPEAEAVPEPAPPTTTPAGSTLTLVDVRRLWPDIVEATKQRRRITWIYLTQQAHVVGVDDATLTLGFANAGARDSFDAGGSGEIVRQAAIDVVGHDWRIDTIIDPGAEPPTTLSTPGRPVAGGSSTPEPVADPAASSSTQPAAGPAAGPVTEAPDWARSDPKPAEPHPSASAREAIAAGREGGEPARPPEPDDGARPDDTDMESSGLDGAQLLQEALGAQVIEQIPHQ